MKIRRDTSGNLINLAGNNIGRSEVNTLLIVIKAK